MPNKPSEYTHQYLKNKSADTSVSPPIPREGIMGKGADGSWYNIGVNVDGSLGSNASLELGYNAAGQLVRIRKTIGSTTYTKNVTGDEITDTTVDTVKTYSVWS